MTDAAPREGWYIVTPQGGSPICAHRSLKGQWGINGMNVGHDLPPGWTLGPRIEDLLSREQKGQNEPCYHCGKPCNSLAGNPLLWPTMVPAERSCRPMHMGCVADLLRDAARYRWLISKRRTYKEGARIAQWFDDRDLCPSEDEISAMIDAEIARERDQ